MTSHLPEALHEVLAELGREEPSCDGHFPGEPLPEDLQLSARSLPYCEALPTALNCRS